MNIIAPHATVKSHAVNFFPLDEAERKNFDKHERLTGIYPFLAPFRDAYAASSVTACIQHFGLNTISDLNQSLRHFVCAVYNSHTGREVLVGDTIDSLHPANGTKSEALLNPYISLNVEMRSLISIEISGEVPFGNIRSAPDTPNLLVWSLAKNPHLRPGASIDSLRDDTVIVDPVLIFNLCEAVCFTSCGRSKPQQLYSQAKKRLCRAFQGISYENISLNPCSPLNGWIEMKSDRRKLGELVPGRHAVRSQGAYSFAGSEWQEPNRRHTWVIGTALIRDYYFQGRWSKDDRELALFTFDLNEQIHDELSTDFDATIVGREAAAIWRNFDPAKANSGNHHRGRDSDVEGDTRTKQSTAADRTNQHQLEETAARIKQAIHTVYQELGRMPSQRALARKAGVCRQTVQRHLAALWNDPDWRIEVFERIRRAAKEFSRQHLRMPSERELVRETGYSVSIIQDYFAGRSAHPGGLIRCRYSEIYNITTGSNDGDRSAEAAGTEIRRSGAREFEDSAPQKREDERHWEVEDYILGQLHQGSWNSLDLNASESHEQPFDRAWWLDTAARTPRAPLRPGATLPDRPRRVNGLYIYMNWRGEPTRDGWCAQFEASQRDSLQRRPKSDDELRLEFLKGLRSKRSQRQIFSTCVLVAAARLGLSSDQLFDAQATFPSFLTTAKVRAFDGRPLNYADLFLEHVESMSVEAKSVTTTPISTAEVKQALGRWTLHKEEADILARELVKLCGPGVDKAWAAEVKAGRRRPTRSPALDYALFAAECLRRPPAYGR